jgi:hypothetical protein
VKWNLGNSTWEPLGNCNELVAMDDYLTLMKRQAMAGSAKQSDEDITIDISKLHWASIEVHGSCHDT